jgi:hypothetical protein
MPAARGIDRYNPAVEPEERVGAWGRLGSIAEIPVISNIFCCPIKSRLEFSGSKAALDRRY